MGRKGYQRFGVPVSGAMDTYSAAVANRLVGNDVQSAVLECTFTGPVLRFTEPALIAFTGCEAPLTLDGIPVASWESHLVKAGSVLAVGSAAMGCRGYLAVAGGIDTPVVMGSRSTFVRGALGGLNGRALKAGDVLPVGQAKTVAEPGRFATFAQRVTLPRETTSVRVMFGPEEDMFTAEARDIFISADYKVTTESDRMGYRMQGPTLSHKIKADILSGGIAPGSVQVPGHGQPIIMLADRQSIGGYAKIATVIGADLPLLCQMRPGQSVRFVPVSREEAVTALRQLESLRDSKLHGPSPRRQFSVRLGSQLIKVDLQEFLGE
jgi:biotin-dependent carboxylase-like uncharacterized protein